MESESAASSRKAKSGHLFPILASAGILLAGNGLLVTLVAVRAGLESFPDSLIGLMGSIYFVGFMAGCLVVPRLIRRAGHIRTFASLAAVAAISILAMVTWLDPAVWLASRALTGFCFAGTATVVESWLGELAVDRERARILSIYRVVDLVSVTAGQFLLPVIGPGGHDVFVAVAALFCLALVPVSLSRLVSPPPPEQVNLRVGFVWRISPLAAAGCITIGIANASFRTLGPVYAKGMGLAVTEIASFLSLGIIAGALLQYPLGWLSDRTDRRFTIFVATTGAALASAFMLVFGGTDTTALYVGAFMFGGFSLPLYSLSSAHAYDYAGPGQFVELAAGLTLFYAIGASIGPFASSLIIEAYGPSSFFATTVALHSSFALFVLFRMTQRRVVPREARSRFHALLRTSPAIFRLTRTRR